MTLPEGRNIKKKKKKKTDRQAQSTVWANNLHGNSEVSIW